MWAEEDRPREKLMERGKSALTNAELIAILLGSGSREQTAVDLAKDILGASSNSINELAKLEVESLMKFKGIGEAKAISIVSALELGRRRLGEVTKRQKIQSSLDLYNLIKPHLMDLKVEEFWVVLLNKANVVMDKVQISSGGVSGTVADARLIFKPAISALASAVILIHNHPSGNLKPSTPDIKLTDKMKKAGELLDINVLDHIIFTDKGYYSFADDGMI